MSVGTPANVVGFGTHETNFVNKCMPFWPTNANIVYSPVSFVDSMSGKPLRWRYELWICINWITKINTIVTHNNIVVI